MSKMTRSEFEKKLKAVRTYGTYSDGSPWVLSDSGHLSAALDLMQSEGLIAPDPPKPVDWVARFAGQRTCSSEWNYAMEASDYVVRLIRAGRVGYVDAAKVRELCEKILSWTPMSHFQGSQELAREVRASLEPQEVS